MKKILLLISIFIFSYGAVEAQTTTTSTVSSLTYEEATLNGSANPNGLPSGTTYDVYFKYWEVPAFGSPSYNYEKVASGIAYNSGNQTYSYTWTGLDPATDYAYTIFIAHGSTVDSESSPDETFTTHALPTVSTGSVGTITKTSAVLNGSGDANGGTFTTSFGYKKSSDVTYSYIAATPSSISGTSSTSFSTTLTGLDAGTQYDFTAALFDGTNKIVEGSAVQFTTNAATAPGTVTTGTIENTTNNSADVNTNSVADDGGAELTSYGIYYGTTSPPSSQKEVGNTGFSSYPANFSTALTGGVPSTKYYIQAYATNSVGTTRGVEKTVYTEPSTVTHFDATTTYNDDHTKLTLNFGGSTVGNGSGVIIKAAIEGSATITQPVDGTGYPANSTYSANNQTVYVGPNSGSVTITGLDGSKDYEFQMWDYSGAGPSSSTDYGINYKTDVVPQRVKTSTTDFPIELLSFTAKNDNGNILINWSTASETDNDFFEIERSSDAEHFEAIANVPGAGYSNEVLNYSIQDNAALEGTVYYRLKQTDFNGAFTYSYVLPVQIGAKNELQISNIINTDNSISFIYNNNQGGNTLVELLDMNGRVVKTQQVSGEGSQMVRMNMRGMSRGIYVLHLTLNDQTIVKKVVF